MTKKERAIIGLKCCLDDHFTCVSEEFRNPDCPYWNPNEEDYGCMRRLFNDALDIIEGEEESRPEINPECHGLGHANCEICDTYCPWR